MARSLAILCGFAVMLVAASTASAARQLSHDTAWQPCPHCHPGTPEVAPGAFFCESLPEAQEKCGAMAFAEMQDGWASADWMEGIKAGAVQWYNENLAENWRRLECAPLEGARLACQNKWSPTNWAVVFDADCGEAGTATLQAHVSANEDGTVNYWGLVDVLCRPPA